MLTIVKEQLDILASVFGGYNEIINFIPEKQLNYLGSFPGDFLVVAPWIIFDNPTDLTQIGFTPNSTITIYNQHWDFIYSRSSEGFFGQDELDKSLIINSYHGEFFHLSFETQGITKIVLLWIAKTFDSLTKQRLLDFYKNNETVRFNRLQFNELLLLPQSLSSLLPVTVYSVPGSWINTLTPQQIQDNFKVISFSFDSISDSSTLYIQPSLNHWYCFKQGDSWLSLSNISGVGLDSWKDSGLFTYFFDSSLVNNSRLLLNNNLLLPSNDYRLQLHANLLLPSYNFLAQPSISSTLNSSAPVVSTLSLNCSSSLSLVSASSISASLSSISTQSSRSSVSASLSIIPPAQLNITAATNAATVYLQLFIDSI